jgi:glycosyltransferase involved in cell wall biosynthesis
LLLAAARLLDNLRLHVGDRDRERDDRGRPLVSTIIPTCNRPELLRRALDSVYRLEGLGEHFDVEVTVVDDAASDATRDVVASYTGVRYIRPAPGRGVAAARNTGIAASTGSLVAFLDDDDVWLPRRITLQLPVLQRRPDAGAVYSQVQLPDGRVRPPTDRAPSGWIFDRLLQSYSPAVTSVLIRRRALDQVGGFDERLRTSEDWDLWLRFSRHFPVVFEPGVVAVYNRSPDGLSSRGVASGLALEDKRRVVEKAAQLLPDSPQSAQMLRDARARAELGVYALNSRLGDAALAWKRVETAVRADPWILNRSWALVVLHEVADARARAERFPLASGREMCASIQASSARADLRARWRAWRAVAGIWLAVAHVLATRPGTSSGDAAYAAACAVIHGPWLLGRKRWLRLVLRIALGAVVGIGKRSVAINALMANLRRCQQRRFHLPRRVAHRVSSLYRTIHHATRRV